MTIDAEHMNESELRGEVVRLRQREQRIADLIGTANLDKLEHDLRNVLNELALLRKLSELESDG